MNNSPSDNYPSSQSQMKGYVITGQFNEFPPLHSVGTIEILIEDKILFVPDKDEDLPPDYCHNRSFFSGYLMTFNDVRVQLEDEDHVE